MAPPCAIILTGPTASGKSGLALEMVRYFQSQGRESVIINADSVQLYAEIPILASSPSEEEQKQVPHYLYGILRANQAASAAEWAELAAKEIRTACLQHTIPIIVGGTGLYIRTLIEGIAAIPPIDPAIREEIRHEAQTKSSDYLYQKLQSVDMMMAAKLHPEDTQRVSRALEVVLSTDQSLLYWQSLPRSIFLPEVVFHPYVLLPPRALLYSECDRRFLHALQHGAVEEVQTILTNYPAHTIQMNALGFKEIQKYLQNQCSKDEAIKEGSQAIRHYAKRQMTWMRHQLHYATFLTGILSDIDRQIFLKSVHMKVTNV